MGVSSGPVEGGQRGGRCREQRGDTAGAVAGAFAGCTAVEGVAEAPKACPASCDVLQEAVNMNAAVYDVLVELFMADPSDAGIDRLAACADGMGVNAAVFARALYAVRPGYSPPSLGEIAPGDDSIVAATRRSGVRVPVSAATP